MNRRGFLGTILVLATPPAIVRAGSLMPVQYRPTEFFDGDFCIEYWVHPETRWFNEIRLTRGYAGPGARSITPMGKAGREWTAGWVYVRTDVAGLSLLPDNLRLKSNLPL